MHRYIFISLIGHLLLGLIVILITLFQPNYKRLPRQKATRVKFYTLPPEPQKRPPQKKPNIKELHQPPKPKPTPPPKKIIKKEEKKLPPKSKKTPVPKKTKAAPTTKPTPRRTPRETPKPTPKPQRTVWPPPPGPEYNRSKPTPIPHPPAPTPLPNTPVQISHGSLPSYYLLMATQKIESNFNLARSQRYEGIDCIVEFKVNKEGNIYDVMIIKSTGKSSLDQFALEAVKGTGSLGPLPDSIKESFISITAKFEYSPDSN